MNRFQNKNVIITGGAGGIGEAVCRRFAREGAQVWILDSNARAAAALAEDISAAGGRARWQAVDLSSREAIAAFVSELKAQESRIDVLINNAGINRRGALLDLSETDWEETFTVNLDALFHMCRAVLPHMIAQGGGAIVNTASQWGLHPAPGHIAYNTSKAAVAAFTLNLARDYAPAKVRVNAVCPGEVRTPMLESNLARSGRSLDDLNALVPFGRIGEPEEIAAAIAFLASDEAPYLCGSLLEITGAQAVA
ncbi:MULTISPECIES: SDR family NAD(P)-dependent oxidoreductase [Pantoea]|jgi:2-hydroxycyclohexanecarboxyl-CoA dehydrogenase|uniref:SDR family NAD(P)-dependent oxidoreductase n=1 Tax=Pantoea TaxID=53335 RepID=UPI000EA20B4A|nr:MULTISPECIES: SDR family NAD(P)-dependent oxidoreductase [Pantoea]MBZ6384364.1 SDR family oxidoreductase [Pantoea piersonii]MBZ6399923.1 SDR family oxidoreductase [Pantoea piersonii]MBZ6406375.1 SDR family oxidoreductase [Pantoea piersonii]MBZ6425121.1 SDR family oxidoreductase [Pantoea piersonii]NYB02710.1 SDR family oxidoreductase [Pantoea piersonii]